MECSPWGRWLGDDPPWCVVTPHEVQPLLQQAFIPVEVKEASITVGSDADLLGEHAPRPHIHLQRRVLGQKGELTMLSTDFLRRFLASRDRTSEDDLDHRQTLYSGDQYHAPCLRRFTHSILWSDRHWMSSVAGGASAVMLFVVVFTELASGVLSPDDTRSVRPEGLGDVGGWTAVTWVSR